MSLRAPFPYIGGKAKVAAKIWEALGDVYTYVEPFAGSAAVLLNRPPEHGHRREIINDADGLIVNVWRSLAWHPDITAKYADWPSTESDLHARHVWLLNNRESMTSKLEGDPGWHDPAAAGWWLWGASLWIGSGWCAGVGKWQVVDGELVPLEGISLGGVNRKRQKVARIGGVIETGGINRQRQDLTGRGVFKGADTADLDGIWNLLPWGNGNHLHEWFHAIAGRLEKVSIIAGDWKRVTGPVPLHGGADRGIAGVFLDPPYSHDQRHEELYAMEDADVAAEVRAWCLEVGGEPNMRIVLAGMDDEHDELLEHGWRKELWSSGGGYARGETQDRRHTEALWISPHCLEFSQQALW